MQWLVNLLTELNNPGTVILLVALVFASVAVRNWRRSLAAEGAPVELVADDELLAEELPAPPVRHTAPRLAEGAPQVRHESGAVWGELERARATSGAAPAVDLMTVAQADNVLVVGPKGSGKTTLLRRLIALRTGAHVALDPHAAPSKWPCPVVGGGRDYEAIKSHLQASEKLLTARYRELCAGERAEGDFERYTLVGDEWRSISTSVAQAGAVLAALLTEGRKVGQCVAAAAHSDTADSLGLHGNMALLACFDWMLYLGGQATGNTKIPASVRQAAQQQPRPAVALDTERQQWYLLDTSGAMDGAMPSAMDGAIERNIAGYSTPEPHSIAHSSWEEQVAELAASGLSTRKILAQLGGDYNRICELARQARVESVRTV